jgi:hypothetical protein
MEQALRIGPFNFEPVVYFADLDHLRAGAGQIGGGDDRAHVFFFNDAEPDPVGVELFGPRHQLETEGAITITLPTGERTRVPDAEEIVRQALQTAA